MQQLAKGPLTDILADGSIVWLDGGHNPDAGAAIAKVLEDGPPVHVIIGMLKNKDAIGFLKPFAHKIASLRAVPIQGHEHHSPADMCAWARDILDVADAMPFDDVSASLRAISAPSGPAQILICGSLYLAGEVLRLNNQVPD